jgi:O-antigen ligase
VNHISVLHDRFYGAGQSGLSVSDSGRSAIWRVEWHDYLHSPWLGRGPGTGVELARTAIYAPGYQGAATAHNDYLQVLHDYGPLGLALWIAVILVLLRRLRRGASSERWVASAYLSLIGLTVVMLTDGPMIAADVMLPLGVLVGMGLARTRPRRQARRQRTRFRGVTAQGRPEPSGFVP